MRQTSKVEGTKIAQAAKDLNVTSVTIRRYLSEFNIETATDENGIKVLPDRAMEELKTIRRLKEDGLTNPKVMEQLEANRSEDPPSAPAKSKDKEPSQRLSAKAKPAADEVEDSPAETKKTSRRAKVDEEPREPDLGSPEGEEPAGSPEQTDERAGEAGSDQRPKHSLTCQTCGKVFEHMNPRLRDCLDCYRTKRKERRRGGSDKHKNVIQHPIARQVVNKASQQSQSVPLVPAYENGESPADQPHAMAAPVLPPPPTVGHLNSALQRGQVRNYRKAIEETRQITGSLKRRLERPDLPEGDRRWLEQIYAYQLILHQGWRHLSDYKNNTQAAKPED
jgi:DNA-binding transcriptional MerR regulator